MSNAHLHPVFASICDDIKAGPAIVRRAQYEAALRGHDWAYEWSDDHRVWHDGRARREWLRGEQRAIDPDGAIWNAIAPEGYRIEVAGAIDGGVS